jgi:hypothetical protein
MEIIRKVDRFISENSLYIYSTQAVIGTLVLFAPYILELNTSMDNTLFREVFLHSLQFKIANFANIMVTIPIAIELFFDCFGSVPTIYILETALILITNLQQSLSYFIFPDSPFALYTFSEFSQLVFTAITGNALSSLICNNPKVLYFSNFFLIPVSVGILFHSTYLYIYIPECIGMENVEQIIANIALYSSIIPIVIMLYQIYYFDWKNHTISVDEYRAIFYCFTLFLETFSTLALLILIKDENTMRTSTNIIKLLNKDGLFLLAFITIYLRLFIYCFENVIY